MTVFCLLGKEQPVFLVAFEFEVWTRKFEIQKSQREREGERERESTGQVRLEMQIAMQLRKCDILSSMSENERPPLVFITIWKNL